MRTMADTVPPEPNLPAKPQGYGELLGELVTRIREAQQRAAVSVNRETVLLYWGIGNEILARQRERGWGAKVIDRLAADLRRAFPGVKGFSARNLKYMRALAEDWPDEAIVQQLLHKLPWFHLCVIHDKVKEPAEREWYVRACIDNGWSRNVLAMQIDTDLYRREGAAVTNFERTLPATDSDLALQTLKDPYNFDFLTLAEPARERAIERGLVEHIRDFLLELGRGFAFVGSQVPIEVGGEEFRLDLLFFHLQLRRYVVIELKGGGFAPEHAGKLNFYLSAVDDLMRHPEDGATIGLLLCRDKNRVVAEYALRGLTQPVGVSEYELTASLPAELADGLPTVDELEAELATTDGN